MKRIARDSLKIVILLILTGWVAVLIAGALAGCATNGVLPATVQPMIRCPADQSVLMMDVPAPGENGVYKFFATTNGGIAKTWIVETFECPECGNFYFTTNLYKIHSP